MRVQLHIGVNAVCLDSDVKSGHESDFDSSAHNRESRSCNFFSTRQIQEEK